MHESRRYPRQFIGAGVAVRLIYAYTSSDMQNKKRDRLPLSREI